MNRLGMITIILTVLLAGCQSTGGAVGGLLPAPKLLSGEVIDDRYRSKNKIFSIQVPHSQSSYEYKYMVIKEQYADLGAYVSFGPAAFDKSIYRLELANRFTPQSQAVEIGKVIPQIIAGTVVQLERVYGAKLELQSKAKSKINGNEAFHLVFSQEVPAGKFLRNNSALFKHEVYIIDLNTFAAMIWVQMPPEGLTKPSAPALTALEFAESLRVHPQ